MSLVRVTVPVRVQPGLLSFFDPSILETWPDRLVCLTSDWRVHSSLFATDDYESQQSNAFFEDNNAARRLCRCSPSPARHLHRPRRFLLRNNTS